MLFVQIRQKGKSLRKEHYAGGCEVFIMIYALRLEGVVIFVSINKHRIFSITTHLQNNSDVNIVRPFITIPYFRNKILT